MKWQGDNKKWCSISAPSSYIRCHDWYLFKEVEKVLNLSLFLLFPTKRDQMNNLGGRQGCDILKKLNGRPVQIVICFDVDLLIPYLLTVMRKKDATAY